MYKLLKHVKNGIFAQNMSEIDFIISMLNKIEFSSCVKHFIIVYVSKLFLKIQLLPEFVHPMLEINYVRQMSEIEFGQQKPDIELKCILKCQKINFNY